MARQTIKIDSGGDDLDFIADIIGDVGDLLLDTKLEKLYDKEGWGSRTEEIDRDTQQMKMIAEAFSIMNAEERDEHLALVEDLTSPDKAYQVRDQANFVLMALTALDDQYDLNEAVLVDVKRINEAVGKHRGGYDYVPNTDLNDLAKNILTQQQENSDAFTSSTMEKINEAIGNYQAMGELVPFFKLWKDVDEDTEGFQVVPEIPETRREGIESMFDLWEQGLLSHSNFYNMVQDKKWVTVGEGDKKTAVQVPGMAIFGRNPYVIAGSTMYMDIENIDNEASRKLNVVSKVFNTLLTKDIKESLQIADDTDAGGIVQLTQDQYGEWNKPYRQLIRSTYTLLHHLSTEGFWGYDDPIAKEVPAGLQTVSAQIEALEGAYRYLKNNYELVDLKYGKGYGMTAKGTLLDTLEAILGPNGLESLRKEKDAIYGDIIDVGNMMSVGEGSDDPIFAAAVEYIRSEKAIHDEEEIPVPDIPSRYDEYPTTSISRPIANLANIAGYPVDAISGIVNWFLPPELQSDMPIGGAEWIKRSIMPGVEAIDRSLK